MATSALNSLPSQMKSDMSASTKSPSQARIQASFADLMANQQSESGTRTQPHIESAPDSTLSLRNPVLAGRTPADMLRMQAFNRTQTLDGLLQSSGTINEANGLRTIAAGGNGAGFALKGSDYIHTNRAASAGKSRKTAANTGEIGKLSAQFESGGAGIAAIGYDRTGGTSYGKYQIASRVGSMSSFLKFLDGQAPDLAKRLRESGPANTGSRSGAMPTEWKAIASEQPERFERLQEAFIRETHYDPAVKSIASQLGLNVDGLSAATREVVWSTAVQHGPAGAARIFAQASSASGSPSAAGFERKLIDNVYAVRGTQFGSSSQEVRNAVRSRFKVEKQLALNMLGDERKVG